VRTPPLEPVPVGAGTGIGGVGGLRRKRLQLQRDAGTGIGGVGGLRRKRLQLQRDGACLMILPSFRNFS